MADCGLMELLLTCYCQTNAFVTVEFCIMGTFTRSCFEKNVYAALHSEGGTPKSTDSSSTLAHPLNSAKERGTFAFLNPSLRFYMHILWGHWGHSFTVGSHLLCSELGNEDRRGGHSEGKAIRTTPGDNVWALEHATGLLNACEMNKIHKQVWVRDYLHFSR